MIQNVISIVNEVGWLKLVLYLNWISLLQTLLTYSTLIRIQNSISYAWCYDWFASLLWPPSKELICKEHQWQQQDGWWLEMPAGNSSTGESSRFAAAWRSRPCGQPREVLLGFTNVQKLFFFFREEFSEGQPSGSTAWRFGVLVSISFYPKRWPSWGFCSWWEAHGFLVWMVSASLSYIPSMLVVMLSHSR